MKKFLALLIVLLAAHVYRLQRPIRNIFVLPPLRAKYSPFKNCEILHHREQRIHLRYCEDEVLWHANGINRLILSCDPGRKEWNTVMGPLHDPVPRGNLWLYTPSTKKFELLTLKNYPTKAYFHPLGVDVYTDPKTSNTYLAAVNHGANYTTIEIFRLDEDTKSDSISLTYHRTISSPWFRAPNAVRLTSPTSFYITQDHFFTRRLPWPYAPFLPLLETYLAIPTGLVNHVTFKDSPSPSAGSDVEVDIFWPALFIPFANGLAISPSGTEVAVASSVMNAVYLYTRDPQTQRLQFKQTIEVPFAADNLDYTHSGDIIITGHPHFPSLVDVARKGNKYPKAPSWVVEISRMEKVGAKMKEREEGAPYSVYERANRTEGYNLRTLYQSNGLHFQSSTTGAWDEKTKSLFVTGLYEDGLLACHD